MCDARGTAPAPSYLELGERLARSESARREAESQIDYWRVKARCYGDMVHGCSPALAAAGFPVDGTQSDGAVGGIARSVTALANALASERAAREKADKRAEEAERAFEEKYVECDRYSDALSAAHVALGGDGEWVTRIPEPHPPESGDLARDVPVLAASERHSRVAAERERDEWRANATLHGGNFEREALAHNVTRSSLSRAVEALRGIRRRIPAHHEGEYFVEHFGPDGEYIGSESVNPVDIIASIVGALDAVLAEVGR